MNNILLILTLSQLKGIGNMTISKFLDFTDNRINLTHLEIIQALQQLAKKDKRIPSITNTELIKAEEQALKIMEISIKNDIQIIAFGDENYPYQLYDIHNAPMILYIKGNIQALDNPTVAFVGTREPSNYGKVIGTRLAEVLIENELTILSGLALGCDTIGHQKAVQNNKETIAILGGGLQAIYPKENTKLAHEILENNGLLITEFPFGQNPTQYTFVQRDRLQSALSHGTIIVQTDVRGGTLNTAKFANQQSKILACLCTNNLEERKHPKFQGNQQLIRQGAFRIYDKKSLNTLISKVKKSHDLKHKFHEQLLTLF